MQRYSSHFGDSPSEQSYAPGNTSCAADCKVTGKTKHATATRRCRRDVLLMTPDLSPESYLRKVRQRFAQDPARWAARFHILFPKKPVPGSWENSLAVLRQNPTQAHNAIKIRDLEYKIARADLKYQKQLQHRDRVIAQAQQSKLNRWRQRHNITPDEETSSSIASSASSEQIKQLQSEIDRQNLIIKDLQSRASPLPSFAPVPKPVVKPTPSPVKIIPNSKPVLSRFHAAPPAPALSIADQRYHEFASQRAEMIKKTFNSPSESIPTAPRRNAPKVVPKIQICQTPKPTAVLTAPIAPIFVPRKAPAYVPPNMRQTSVPCVTPARSTIIDSAYDPLQARLNLSANKTFSPLKSAVNTKKKGFFGKLLKH